MLGRYGGRALESHFTLIYYIHPKQISHLARPYKAYKDAFGPYSSSKRNRGMSYALKASHY